MTFLSDFRFPDFPRMQFQNTDPDDFERTVSSHQGQGRHAQQDENFLNAFSEARDEMGLMPYVFGTVLGVALYFHDRVLVARMVDQLADAHKAMTGADVPRIKTPVKLALMRSVAFGLAAMALVQLMGAWAHYNRGCSQREAE